MKRIQRQENQNVGNVLTTTEWLTVHDDNASSNAFKVQFATPRKLIINDNDGMALIKIFIDGDDGGEQNAVCW